MAKQLQIRRGKTDEIDNFIGAEGELTYDTESKEVKVHDGVTKGGINVSAPVTLTPATPIKAGVIQLATQTEVSTGVNATKAVTPATMNGGVKPLLGIKGDAPIFAARAVGTIESNRLVVKGNVKYTSTEVNRRGVVVFNTPLMSNSYTVMVSSLDPSRRIEVMRGSATKEGFTFVAWDNTTNETRVLPDFSFVVYEGE